MSFRQVTIDRYTLGACHLLAEELVLRGGCSLRPAVAWNRVLGCRGRAHAFAVLRGTRLALVIVGVRTIAEVLSRHELTCVRVYESIPLFRRDLLRWPKASAFGISRSELRRVALKVDDMRRDWEWRQRKAS